MGGGQQKKIKGHYIDEYIKWKLSLSKNLTRDSTTTKPVLISPYPVFE